LGVRAFKVTDMWKRERSNRFPEGDLKDPLGCLLDLPRETWRGGGSLPRPSRGVKAPTIERRQPPPYFCCFFMFFIVNWCFAPVYTTLTFFYTPFQFQIHKITLDTGIMGKREWDVPHNLQI